MVEQKMKVDRKNLVERYIFDVVRRLPGKQRADIEQELRGLIDDMLTARTGGMMPGKEDIEAVLGELGRPGELAAKYRGTERFLIGPDYFDIYWLIVRIVMAATAFGITVAMIVGNITVPPQNVGLAIGQFFLDLFLGVVQAFAWVTVIFALIQRFAGKGSAEKMKEEFRETWKPADLPDLPAAKTRIGVGEPVVGIVFGVIGIVILTIIPHLIGVYVATDPVTIIPIFDLDVWQKMLPLIVIICSLGIIKEVARLISGRYTLKLAAAVTVIDIATIILVISVFLPSAIWNGDLIPSLRAASDMTWAGDVDLEYIWSIVPMIIVGLTIFGNVIDIITNWVRGARNAVKV